ncbi:MAG TPA: EscU/YscU/HrcU family type III secretion system export apparatus switch protein [Bacillota bacterium]|nr:EscU/YscU/HrcU family type III secretion system export apparatus switch protein [Bacillota bacterium]HOL10863.1 EscU/YscU/HrcU family type III secretion system export apparatus switch protein [Bacillota bacterium]HPO98631.1 EscU/YscU/HrcU family type III secretion system export apparatus switch protein [Bacillota bacterium]
MDVTKRNPPKQPKYAAALRYQPGIDHAPVVVASGQGRIAEIIMQLAQEAGVPSHVEPTLAKVLSGLEPGTPIPEETYHLVATILAFIWKMDQKYQQ